MICKGILYLYLGSISKMNHLIDVIYKLNSMYSKIRKKKQKNKTETLPVPKIWIKNSVHVMMMMTMTTLVMITMIEKISGYSKGS